jgi:ribonuclease HII
MKYPNCHYERKLWKRGFKLVAGLDEVGRGAFAGPVVASAVALAPMSNYKIPIINEEGEKIIINDSKKLTDRQRRISEKWIKGNCLTWGMGEASVAEINRLGMSKATASAFRRSVANANIRAHKRVDYLLIDAYFIPYTRGLPVGVRSRTKTKRGKRNRAELKTGLTQKAIVNGDEKSLSIAAASIIAKVYRDDLMIKKSKNQKFQVYKWEKNKGYGTKQHRDAIRKFGATSYHRKSFVVKYV